MAIFFRSGLNNPRRKNWNPKKSNKNHQIIHYPKHLHNKLSSDSLYICKHSDNRSNTFLLQEIPNWDLTPFLTHIPIKGKKGKKYLKYFSQFTRLMLCVIFQFVTNNRRKLTFGFQAKPIKNPSKCLQSTDQYF